MSTSLYAYLETSPSLEEMIALLETIGIVFRHTLPPDDRWFYPMHVFGREGLRLVYHAGDPLDGEALLQSSANQENQHACLAMQMALSMVVRHYGGTILDPVAMRRSSLV